MSTEAKRYLTFRVCRRDFAIDASRVRGILPLKDLLPMPSARPAMLGLASLQGKPLAVIDLRQKLALPHPSQGKQRQIVVVEVRGRLSGFVADRVSDVLSYHDRSLREGILKGIGRPRKLLDFDQIVDQAELARENLQEFRRVET